MKQIINMYTGPKGVTRTLAVETEQVGNRLEIDIDLSLDQNKGGEHLHADHTLNLSWQEANRLIDALLPIVKPNKRIITIKQK